MPSLGDERAMLLSGLLAAMRLSQEPMVLTDPHLPDNPIIATNEAFVRLTLYPEPEFIGRNCRFLQGPATDRRSIARLGAAIRGGEGFVEFLANYRKDGTLFWNLLFISPVTGQDGRLHFFFANQHDLSSGPLLHMAEFPLGPAHMPPGKQTEFRLLLLNIAQEMAAADAATGSAARVRALEAALQSAREIAALSVTLAPGTEAWGSHEPT